MFVGAELEDIGTIERDWKIKNTLNFQFETLKGGSRCKEFQFQLPSAQ
jgi:hypothetical protein